MKTAKGRSGEIGTRFNMWWTLNGNLYQRIHNLIIPSKNGTAQIDHLLVSPYGVFIVETKNIKGWIFGSKDQSNWTQSLYGKNYSFQNPLKQTFRQKKVLSKYLDLDESCIHTIIYFVGNCKFKTDFPPNVIKSGLSSYIKQFKNTMLVPEQINCIFTKLKKLKVESVLTTQDHIKSLNERHSSITICPKCGSKLVERMAIKGATAGSQFLGCENYPRCRFTKKCQ